VSALNGLTVAVPRGALFEDTVALLARLGVDTDELRSNDRKLLFAEIGVITMRPSDVPTYVEAGAADIGITGKDVLAERATEAGRHARVPASTEAGRLPPSARIPRSASGAAAAGREVYELLDLGYGRCTMVVASIAGDPDPAAEALRRLGVMRVATKYPRTAAQHFEETGRQAEIVEVKGSVELAPLTGLVEAIVDLTATGTTLRENNLQIREQLFECTARLIANPVAHKLKAGEIDELLEWLRADHTGPGDGA
jgi:ATP phosphoribosyltransferase